MPELPEVETIKNDLLAKVSGYRVDKIIIHDKRVIKGCAPAAFVAHFEYKRLTAIERFGKALVFSFGPQTFLFIQLRMTGVWLVMDKMPDPKSDRAIKITFKLSPLKYLVYNDQRVLGSLTYTDDTRNLPFIKNLGSDPFDRQFTTDKFRGLLQSKKAPIKNALLDQRIIAGIGNIYASESLFVSGIDPRRPAGSLKKEEVALLRERIRAVLTLAIKMRGTSMRNYRDASGQKGNYISQLKVYGKSGKPCTICHSTIKRIVQAGRSTFYCEHCQK